jgi:uncharacterized protein (DUF1501 family)
MNDILPIRRRSFAQGLGLVGIGASLPNFLVKSALAGPQAEADEPILVVIQLAGGNDGLSSIVPFTNDIYYRNRAKTNVPAKEVLKINDELGFCPSLTGFKELYDDGQLSVIQGVGYPNPNRSHFTSMDIWHLADRQQRETNGWLGRYVDTCHAKNPDPKLAMAIQMNKTPRAISGTAHPGVAFRDPDSFRYTADRGNKRRKDLYTELNKARMSEGHTELDWVATTANNANLASEQVRKLAASYTPHVEYPDTRLAKALMSVSAMIAGGLSTRVYYVSQKGFDTHAGQDVRHPQLMEELGGAVLAFQRDLAKHGNAQRVTSMAFSEFGRRVKENASRGCDHGKAGPMFVVGPKVKPGIYGDLPSLTDLDKGDLKHHTDFRSVYATLLEKWLKAPSQKILRESYPLLEFVS